MLFSTIMAQVCLAKLPFTSCGVPRREVNVQGCRNSTLAGPKHAKTSSKVHCGGVRFPHVTHRNQPIREPVSTFHAPPHKLDSRQRLKALSQPPPKRHCLLSRFDIRHSKFRSFHPQRLSIFSRIAYPSCFRLRFCFFFIDDIRLDTLSPHNVV